MMNLSLNGKLSTICVVITLGACLLQTRRQLAEAEVTHMTVTILWPVARHARFPPIFHKASMERLKSSNSSERKGRKEAQKQLREIVQTKVILSLVAWVF